MEIDFIDGEEMVLKLVGMSRVETALIRKNNPYRIIIEPRHKKPVNGRLISAFCFHYADSTIPLLPKSEKSNL